MPGYTQHTQIIPRRLVCIKSDVVDNFIRARDPVYCDSSDAMIDHVAALLKPSAREYCAACQQLAKNGYTKASLADRFDILFSRPGGFWEWLDRIQLPFGHGHIVVLDLENGQLQPDFILEGAKLALQQHLEYRKWVANESKKSAMVSPAERVAARERKSKEKLTQKQRLRFNTEPTVFKYIGADWDFFSDRF
jgi:hypothetical protein